MMHRNPVYWSKPDDFDPDRFSMEGPIPNETTENFNYLPFGGGRRKCIGACHSLVTCQCSEDSWSLSERCPNLQATMECLCTDEGAHITQYSLVICMDLRKEEWQY